MGEYAAGEELQRKCKTNTGQFLYVLFLSQILNLKSERDLLMPVVTGGSNIVTNF